MLMCSIRFDDIQGEGLVVLLVLAAAFVGLIVMLLVLVSAGIRGDHLYAAESFAPRVQRSLRHFSMSFTTMDAGKAHLSMAHKKLPRKFIDVSCFKFFFFFFLGRGN